MSCEQLHSQTDTEEGHRPTRQLLLNRGCVTGLFQIFHSPLEGPDARENDVTGLREVVRLLGDMVAVSAFLQSPA